MNPLSLLTSEQIAFLKADMVATQQAGLASAANISGTELDSEIWQGLFVDFRRARDAGDRPASLAVVMKVYGNESVRSEYLKLLKEPALKITTSASSLDSTLSSSSTPRLSLDSSSSSGLRSSRGRETSASPFDDEPAVKGHDNGLSACGGIRLPEASSSKWVMPMTGVRYS